MSRWLLLLACLLGGCERGLTPIPDSTTRVGKPEVQEGTELYLKIFTTVEDCRAKVKPDELHLCMPYVDRANGEVRIAFQFRLDSDVFPLPLAKEHLKVGHQGRELKDGAAGNTYAIIPHAPIRFPQLFILLIDGSSSMAKARRLEKVRSALLMPEVKEAFFPEDINTRVVIFQFTDRGAWPLGGQMRVLESKREYTQLIKRELRVLSGYTHLYDAITFATGEFLQRSDIQDLLELYEMSPTVVALTDGFNNLGYRDTCRSNASRLSTLLRHLDKVRSPEDGADPRRRPSVYTVGLGRPLRPLFKLPEERSDEVRPRDLCGKRYVDRRIDGDLENRGIDNASLEWIAWKGGGASYVRQDRDGLGQAFRGAAAERYEWFEARYRTHPFWLRRTFRTTLRLVSFATAEASVLIQPSAWLDAPPGRKGEGGWSEQRPFRYTAVVLMPLLGLLLTISYLGAALFNTRRALFGRVRRPPAPTTRPEPPPGDAPP